MLPYKALELEARPTPSAKKLQVSSLLGTDILHAKGNSVSCQKSVPASPFFSEWGPKEAVGQDHGMAQPSGKETGLGQEGWEIPHAQSVLEMQLRGASSVSSSGNLPKQRLLLRPCLSPSRICDVKMMGREKKKADGGVWRGR